MIDNTIKITYESLFELLRNEKNKEELQSLDKEFFKNIIEYLNEKKSILDKPDDNIFIESEKQKARHQLENIKKITKDLCQRREKKIISMALIKSTVGANVDESNLLEEEKLIFDYLVDLFDKYKTNVLNKIIEGVAPDKDGLIVNKIVNNINIKEGINKIGTIKDQKYDEVIKNGIFDENMEIKEENKVIRFLQYIPSFLGTDLNNYGPFEPEDIARLPCRMAKLLIDKKAAEEISVK